MSEDAHPQTSARVDGVARIRRDGDDITTLRNIAISLLHLTGITKITRTLQAISRDRTRVLRVIPLSIKIEPTLPIPCMLL